MVPPPLVTLLRLRINNQVPFIFTGTITWRQMIIEVL
jgi:hypothetical protein